MKESARSLPARAHHHAVRFYENEKSLAHIVGQFLSDGLAAGSPAIVVATPAQRGAFVRELANRSLDVVQLQRSDDLILLDAQDTLATFMTNGKRRIKRVPKEGVEDMQRRVAAGREIKDGDQARRGASGEVDFSRSPCRMRSPPRPRVRFCPNVPTSSR